MNNMVMFRGNDDLVNKIDELVSLMGESKSVCIRHILKRFIDEVIAENKKVVLPS
jgi:predicted transcriptional regulator